MRRVGEQKNTINYMKRFASFENLTEKFTIKYCEKTRCSYLYLDDPRLLARFAGYLKKNMKKFDSKVYFRGQYKDYGTMIPSLFRGDITEEVFKFRYLAYNELITSIQNDFRKNRFKKDSVEPLLQHYGIKTPWLDLVDNLYTAIWFATCNTKDEEPEPFGWIYFIRTRLDNGGELRYYDLREEQSSLSLRLHVQHGLSATRKYPKWNFNNRSLSDFVVATVKFPLDDKWKLEGPLFERKYMFPSEKYDSTYKYLKGNEKLINIINDITNKYCLSDGELGRIYDNI